jgi:dolichol kinase
MPLEPSRHQPLTLRSEIKRKSIHITGLSVPAAILLFGRDITILLIGLALTVALFLEWCRLRGKIELPAVREHERSQVAGYIYYISGALLTVLFFRPVIAVTAMLMLALGDAASGIMGSMLRGSDVRVGLMEGGKWRPKPWPVILGTFGVCLLVGHLSSLITSLSFIVYLAGAAGATAADAVPLTFRKHVVDDNFTIPRGSDDLGGPVVGLIRRQTAHTSKHL